MNRQQILITNEKENNRLFRAEYDRLIEDERSAYIAEISRLLVIISTLQAQHVPHVHGK
jgi:hypothetical protein